MIIFDELWFGYSFENSNQRNIISTSIQFSNLYTFSMHLKAICNINLESINHKWRHFVKILRLKLLLHSEMQQLSNQFQINRFYNKCVAKRWAIIYLVAKNNSNIVFISAKNSAKSNIFVHASSIIISFANNLNAPKL